MTLIFGGSDFDDSALRPLNGDNFMNKKWLISTAFLAVLSCGLIGCAPAYQVAKPDPATGMLPTEVEVKPEEILVFLPSPKVHGLKFLLLRSAGGGAHTKDFAAFMRSSVKELGIDQILSIEDLTKIVLASPLKESVGNVTDPVALAKISEAIGPFLILDAVQVFQGNAWFETRVRLTDPEASDRLLEIHRIRLNWANLDKEVNYPVLNVLKRWLDESRKMDHLPQAAEKTEI